MSRVRNPLFLHSYPDNQPKDRNCVHTASGQTDWSSHPAGIRNKISLLDQQETEKPSVKNPDSRTQTSSRLCHLPLTLQSTHAAHVSPSSLCSDWAFSSFCPLTAYKLVPNTTSAKSLFVTLTQPGKERVCFTCCFGDRTTCEEPLASNPTEGYLISDLLSLQIVSRSHSERRNNKRLFNESRKSCQTSQHESQTVLLILCDMNAALHESPSFNLILMFKTCVANKPSMCYTTRANVNEAVWYLFETENSSSVNDNVTRSRLWRSNDAARWVEKQSWCHLLRFYEAQSDNLLHTIRWINRPPTSCAARPSERQPGLMIYSSPSTVTLNLFALQLPEGSDVFFSRPLAAAVKMHSGEL